MWRGLQPPSLWIVTTAAVSCHLFRQENEPFLKWLLLVAGTSDAGETVILLTPPLHSY